MELFKDVRDKFSDFMFKDLKNKEEVRKICGAPEKFELMAVFAIGYPAEDGGPGKRAGLDKVIFLRK